MTKRLLCAILTIVFSCQIIVLSFPVKVRAATCANILELFVRGSSQPDIQYNDPDFKYSTGGLQETFTFFDTLEQRIARWVSQEKINLPGKNGQSADYFDKNFKKYNPNGYQAVSAFNFNAEDFITQGTMPNAVEARLKIGDEYLSSVEDGVQTLVGFLEERAAKCPNQQIVLGGYSQGAHVIGEALSRMSNRVLARISYAALFGDPKMVYFRDVSDIATKDKAPWIRGDADWSAIGGGLGVRDPYIPDLLTGRVGSWCNKGDFICTGNPKDINSTVNNQSHEQYDDIWIPQAANEIATFLQGDIKHYAADIKKIDWIPQYGTSLNHDVMIVIDTTGSMGTVINRVKSSAKEVVEGVYRNHSHARVGLVEFRDHDSDFVAKTVVSLTEDKQAVINGINSLQTGDGGDTAEAWYSGIMEAYNQEWRVGARKLLYLFADSEPHDPEKNGLTAQDVIARGIAIDPVQIYPVWLRGYVRTEQQESYQRYSEILANGTGGRLIKAPESYTNTILSEINSAFTKVGSQEPVAFISSQGSAYVGDEVVFAANSSYDPNSFITEYAWDFNNDLVVDYVSDSPRARWVYDQPYVGLATLYIKSKDGGTSSATQEMTIAVQPEPASSAQPQSQKTEQAHAVSTTQGAVSVSARQQQSDTFGSTNRPIIQNLLAANDTATQHQNESGRVAALKDEQAESILSSTAENNDESSVVQTRQNNLKAVSMVMRVIMVISSILVLRQFRKKRS